MLTGKWTGTRAEIACINGQGTRLWSVNYKALTPEQAEREGFEIASRHGCIETIQWVKVTDKGVKV